MAHYPQEVPFPLRESSRLLSSPPDNSAGSSLPVHHPSKTPFICGYFSRMVDSSAPCPPPTSTSLVIPEKSYAPITAALSRLLRLVIPSSNILAAAGFSARYSNTDLPCRCSKAGSPVPNTVRELCPGVIEPLAA